MKRSQPFLVLALCVAACAGQDAASNASWDADMQRELLARVEADQSARERVVTAMRAGATADHARRAAMGLPPLVEYLDVLDSIYAGPPSKHP